MTQRSLADRIVDRVASLDPTNYTPERDLLVSEAALRVVVQSEMSEPTADEAAGMDWWNRMSEADRGAWLARSKGQSAADAWAFFKESVDAEPLLLPHHDYSGLCPTPPNPASLCPEGIMGHVAPEEENDLPTVKRAAWVVVYARHQSPHVTLRELYWSEDAAMERAAVLLPECSEVFVGLMSEMQMAPADATSPATPEDR